jgi:hypothetical protein
MKFSRFTTTELQGVAALIASREMVTQERHDILGELYGELVIELARRRRFGC